VGTFVGTQSSGALNAFHREFGVVPRHTRPFSLDILDSRPLHCCLSSPQCFCTAVFSISPGNALPLDLRDNVEDYLGHIRYLLFYLGSGIVAALSQIIFQPNSAIPT